MKNDIYIDIVNLLNRGYTSERIVKMYEYNPEKITLTKVGAIKMSIDKNYKTSKLKPKTNGLVEWLKR